ncbi:tyrosine-type recombinase/integrase [Mesorhizobium marinum]|uniref:Tyrosine-type recombinase/integrase n=1 Tax=Mesorhizobium marinum TaxID=3228790 RepID=A0ABV3QZI7_9HYPH
MPKITKRVVDTLKPKDKPFVVYDDSLKGFGVRVMPSGTASYVVEYRPDGGGRLTNKKRMAIGRVGELTPDEARELAKDRLGDVRKGHDPLADRQSKRKEMTVADLVALWESEKPVGRRGKPLGELTIQYTLGRLRAHVVPLLGTRKIGSVTTLDINNAVRRIVKGDTAFEGKSEKARGRIRIRGGESTARRTVTDIATIYNFAIDRGFVKTSPVVGVKKPPPNQRRDFLRVDDITKIASSLDEMESEGMNAAGIAILRLLLITGARPSEIESLRWSEVDLAARCLRLNKTKTGHSVRPISTAAMTVIASQPRIERSPYVFPATRGDGYFVGSKKLWRIAAERAGLSGKVRYHARHSVATLSLAAGADVVSVANILGHANPRTTLSTYSHVTDRAGEAAEQIGGLIETAMSGGRSEARVLKLRKEGRS